MSFINCIQAKVDAGLIKKRKAKELQKNFERLSKQYARTMGDDQAAANAAAKIIEVQAARLADKQRAKIRAALAQDRIDKQLAKVKKYDVGVRDLLEKTLQRGHSIVRQAFGRLDANFRTKLESNLFGEAKAPEGLDDVVRVIAGEAPKNKEMKAFAESVRDMFDYLHKRYKAAGGVQGTIENWFPHRHIKEKIKQVDFEQWYGDLRSELDMDRMVDPETGLPFDEAKLKEISKDVYNDIISDGKYSMLKDAEAGKKLGGFGGDFASRRSDARFYHFKDADSFLRYNNKYGVGDDGLSDIIMGHVESMSRDISIMEMMSPDPKALYRHLDLQMSLRDVAGFKRYWTEGMFKVLTGATSVGGDERWVRALGTTQNFLRSAMLGSAAISAMTDTAFLVATARAKGIPAMKAIARYGALLNPANSTDRELAKASNYVAEVMASSMTADYRFTGETLGGRASNFLDKASSKASNFTNRASGLQAMTKALADAISMEAEAHLAVQVKMHKSMSGLGKEFREALEEYGIDEEAWQILRQSPVFQDPRGDVGFLRGKDVLNTPGINKVKLFELSNKLDDFVTGLRSMATNEPGLKTRSITTAFGSQRDNPLRAFISSVAMFKGFPITVMFNHLAPALAKARKGNLEHLGTIVIGATALGYLALQTKQITQGKTPKEMSPKLLFAAMLQGGGLGLFGDFMLGDYSRFGRSPLSEMGGPVAGLADDLFRAVKGNFDQAILEDGGGKDINVARDLFRVVKRNVPGVSLWYSRLVVERVLLDQMERMVDPKYDRRIRRFERQMKNKDGQEYYWRPGNVTPGG